MAKPHWTLEATNDLRGGYGCQHSECHNLAAWQWQREATDEEINAELNLEGNHGQVHRSPLGPHSVAVFSCELHRPELDTMALRHKANCPAPDAGCECS